MVNKSDSRTYSLELKLTRMSNFSRNGFIMLMKLNSGIFFAKTTSIQYNFLKASLILLKYDLHYRCVVNCD